MEKEAKLERQIANLIKSIEGLEVQKTGIDVQIHEKKIELKAYENMRRMFNMPAVSPKVGTLRAGSDMRRIRDILLATNTPLHIDEIIKRLGDKTDAAKAKLSLAGSLGAYAREERVFTRPAPNTFGLIEKKYPTHDFAADPTEGYDDEEPIPF